MPREDGMPDFEYDPDDPELFTIYPTSAVPGEVGRRMESLSKKIGAGFPHNGRIARVEEVGHTPEGRPYVKARYVSKTEIIPGPCEPSAN